MSNIFGTVLTVGVKLDHIFITMINRISRRRLETNCQATINRHVNNIAVKLIANR